MNVCLVRRTERACPECGRAFDRFGFAMAPEPNLRGALRVLFVAAYTTRNWTLSPQFPHHQINALWEAIHEVPDLLQRWRPDAEVELLAYLDEYDSQFDDLHLRDLYVQARDASHL